MPTSDKAKVAGIAKTSRKPGSNVDLSQYLGHILVETVMSFFLLPNLQTPEGLDSESNYEVDSGY
ncbi:hypothetical protein ACWOCJ_12405, partial [Enterococcus pseudoavium]